eukprot:TRINITY_DN162_c0_g1_i7.p1 TRINITY_DN162_c0_g1~~TRINITY_DN162_c0_g1_i7.p1  ORF type:complete len:204 (-),score=61.31 TRINITY_DN162_c0_g1_i7:172-783(-)
MGISRDSFHKRRKTGGKLTKWRKKRKFELGRPPSMTKIGATRIHTVRARGGNLKYRALRLDAGNFSWPSESVTKKCRVLNVVYNASNNELVRTNTLVKGNIIEIDSTPFRQWYEQHYGLKIGKKKEDEKSTTDVKKSNHVQRKQKANGANHTLAREMDLQFIKGRLMAKVTSRPGQSGRCDGFLIEGAELKFYENKMAKKKSK